MRRIIAAFMIILVALPAEAKPKGCFSKPEEVAEQIVRQGLRLREGALGCDGGPWYMKTGPAWADINKRFGDKFAAQTKIRKAAFEREFSKDAENRLDLWDGRIVTHFRNQPLNPIYCGEIKKALAEIQKKGWSVITKEAAKAKDEVHMIYRPCG